MIRYKSQKQTLPERREKRSRSLHSQEKAIKRAFKVRSHSLIVTLSDLLVIVGSDVVGRLITLAFTNI